MPTTVTRRPLVIDARPRGPNGPLAGESVQGRPILGHLLELARGLGGPETTVDVHARSDERDGLQLTLDRPGPVRFVVGPPPEGAVILRADRLYDPNRLRRSVRLGRDPEAAVIWRLDSPAGLSGAGDELARRRSYQPLGRFWALAPARALARLLRPTIVRPNALTLASGALVLGGATAAAVGCDSLVGRLGVAAALALGLVLDTADGHLARLQGTASEFGRWLDANLDEWGDMALHAAIAWAAFARDGWAGWLALGMLYALGKYAYLVGVTTGEVLDAASASVSDPPTASGGVLADASPRGWARRALVLAGHADIRWHLWIVLAALGRLELALIAYAAYFPARALLGLAGKVARHA